MRWAFNIKFISIGSTNFSLLKNCHLFINFYLKFTCPALNKKFIGGSSSLDPNKFADPWHNHSQAIACEHFLLNWQIADNVIINWASGDGVVYDDQRCVDPQIFSPIFSP